MRACSEILQLGLHCSILNTHSSNSRGEVYLYFFLRRLKYLIECAFGMLWGVSNANFSFAPPKTKIYQHCVLAYNSSQKLLSGWGGILNTSINIEKMPVWWLHLIVSLSVSKYSSNSKKNSDFMKEASGWKITKISKDSGNCWYKILKWNLLMEQDEVDNSFMYNICKERKKLKQKSTLKQEKYFKITSFKDATIRTTLPPLLTEGQLDNLNPWECKTLTVYERWYQKINI